ncbi:C-type lectin lectoxin-Phi2-like [Pseudochaenichthys georgianus]|uniref:C-type lectin lectoxin-Phi2-like n=1 Tax=Pseudochaenichthys georgianus TaxID=52239 RepID=UPI0039C13F02
MCIFILTETGPQKYFVIDKPMKWLQAQSYCRTHHTDLISGITHINEFKNQHGSSDSWIGLFREIWRWSDGKNFPFRHWDTDKVILIKEKKTWDEALTYCREKHHDLVSITDRHQQRWVQERDKMADTEFVWLGMRYTCTLDLWFWVIDRLVCYHNWAKQEKTRQVHCDMAAVMERVGEWYKKADNEKFHFICAK